MREIKFRAWDGNRHISFDNHQYDLIYNDISGWNVCPNVPEYKGEWTTGESSSTADKFVLEQYTGLVDKNGKSVYEGDILSVKEYKNNLLGIIGMPEEEMKELREGLSIDEIKSDLTSEYISDVKWEEGCFILMAGRDDYDMPLGCLFGDMKYSSPIFEFEIIGNIHENKDFLK